jgi:hypothetical protein
MTIDHLPSLLIRFTYEFAGYVSAAEGFVFLSGFVAGLTYTRRSLSRPDSELWRRGLRRSGTIYLYHLGLFLALFLTLPCLPLNEGYWSTWIPVLHSNPAVALLMGATFLSQPKFLDILPMYCVFLLVTPIIITQFKRANAFAVLGMSFSLWLVAQLGLRDTLARALIDSPLLNLGEFDFMAWQLLFVGGLFLGFRHYAHSEQPSAASKPIVLYFGLVAAVLFLARRGLIPEGGIVQNLACLADKRTLGLTRVFNFTAILILIAHWYPRIGEGRAVRCLAYLGQHSLQVFAFQILLVSLVNALLTKPTSGNEPLRLVIVALCVASLFPIAWLHERSKKPARGLAMAGWNNHRKTAPSQLNGPPG